MDVDANNKDYKDSSTCTDNCELKRRYDSSASIDDEHLMFAKFYHDTKNLEERVKNISYEMDSLKTVIEDEKRLKKAQMRTNLFIQIMTVLMMAIPILQVIIFSIIVGMNAIQLTPVIDKLIGAISVASLIDLLIVPIMLTSINSNVRKNGNKSE